MMKNLIRKLFAPLAVIALGFGASISGNVNGNFLDTKAAITYTGSEDFEAQTALTASYATSSFINASTGITYSYANSRNEDTYGITSKGLMLRYSDSYLEFTLPSGLSGLKFQYRKAYTGTSVRQLEVLVNGNQVITSPTFGTISGAEATIYNLVYEPASGHSGSTTIRIKNVGTGTTNKQTVIDNIQWAESVSSDVVTSLSVSPTSKTYFTTSTLQQADFSVSVVKNGSAGTSSDYSVKIGSGTGSSFVGTDVVWGTTKPTLSHNTIQVKANFPQTAGQQDFLTVDVALTVNVPSVQSIEISGTPSKTSYFTTELWSPAGLTVIATYEDLTTEDVTANPGLSWSYDPLLPNSDSITSVTMTATFSGQTDSLSSSVTVNEKTSSVIISEMYGNGGNTGATLNNDYIELYNTTLSPVSIAGWTVQYGSSTGTSWSMSSVLSGSIAAKSYYLISLQATPGTNGSSIPTPDATLTGITAGGTNFKIALVNTNNNLGGVANPSSSLYASSVVDFIGAGNANAYEGSAAAPAGSVTTSVSRKNLTDTDDNFVDFEAVSPTPMNSALSVAEKIMAYDGGDLVTAECSAKYNTIKPLVISLSTGQNTYFQTGTESLMVNARARYVQWATANADADLYGSSVPGSITSPVTKSNSISSILLISIIGVTSIVGYYLINKKKQLG